MSALPSWVSEYDQEAKRTPGRFNRERLQMLELVKKAYRTENLIVYEDRFNNYMKVGRWLGYGDGYTWERFLIGCFLCTYKPDGRPRWRRLVVYIGRGAGKSGLITWMAFCLISPYNPVPLYDVDIGAFNEKQALRPVDDVRSALKAREEVFKDFFKWTLEVVECKVNGAKLRGWANNSKGLDGLRSGAVLLDEVHAYENNATMEVFQSGLGKKPDPRLAYFTTEGYVVDGPLDRMIAKAHEVLDGQEDDKGWLYFICKLDSIEEVHDEEAWHKANPSIAYNADLFQELRDVYEQWKESPEENKDFLCKRMNLKQVRSDMPVATMEDLQATQRDLPQLDGCDCVVGVDFAKTTDWVGVTAHFRDGDERYDITHAWICLQSPDLWRLKCPYKRWADEGLVTLVDGPEIPPDMIAEYIDNLAGRYRVKKVCIDSYRYSLMTKALEGVGFSVADKSIYLVRPSDQIRAAPVILRAFRTHAFAWGYNPMLMWATNNACLKPAKKSRLSLDGEADIGNYLFAKQEKAARKTDPFMSLVAAMSQEDCIDDVSGGELSFTAFTF